MILGPNIIGQTLAFGGFAKGAFSAETFYSYSTSASTGHGMMVNIFDASKSSSLYGASNIVQPNALVFNYIIKY